MCMFLSCTLFAESLVDEWANGLLDLPDSHVTPRPVGVESIAGAEQALQSLEDLPLSVLEIEGTRTRFKRSLIDEFKEAPYEVAQPTRVPLHSLVYVRGTSGSKCVQTSCTWPKNRQKMSFKSNSVFCR